MSAVSERDTLAITQHLTRLVEGDSSAAAALMPLVYDELRALAASYLRRERPDHTLQPTALVHEAFLKLVDQRRAAWKDRAHFFAVAAQALRRVLIDHARRKMAAKRVPPAGSMAIEDPGSDAADPLNLLALDEALEQLAQRSARQARVVELRFFGGMSVEEAAEVLGVAAPTVKADWRVARAWLQRELEGEHTA
jgi:RNA polymerase sigma-70 factor (ECF subfamily)